MSTRGADSVLDGGLTADEASMVVDNLGLIGFTLKRFGWPTVDPTYTSDDAYQDGFLGLCRAVKKWDPARGTKFSTMAIPWIRQAMQRGCGDAGGVNVRRATVGRGVYRPPTSIEAPPARADVDVTIADTLIATDDPERDAIGRVAAADLVAARHHVCADPIDRLIFDALLALDGGGSRRAADAHVAAATGLTGEGVRRRRLKLTGRLATLLDRDPPHPIKHGTQAGYAAHIKFDVPPCEPCMVACREYRQALKERAS